jgi:hypothetical protein
LGVTYGQLGDTRHAAEFFEQRLVIAMEIGDNVSVAETSFNMALLYMHNNPSKARDYANDAYRLFSQMGHKQHAASAQALLNELGG